VGEKNERKTKNVTQLIFVIIVISYVDFAPTRNQSLAVTPGHSGIKPKCSKYPSLIRVSVGLEDIVDLIADFDQALRASYMTPCETKSVQKALMTRRSKSMLEKPCFSPDICDVQSYSETFATKICAAF
jgi:hypothetical protein